jgi:hypothetical protein
VESVGGLPSEVVAKLGGKQSVSSCLDMDIQSFARKAGVDVGTALGYRRRMLAQMKLADESDETKPDSPRKA